MSGLQFLCGASIAVRFISFTAQVISKGVDRYGHDSDYVKPKQFTFDALACWSATESCLRP